jgi:hypothetical protein
MKTNVLAQLVFVWLLVNASGAAQAPALKAALPMVAFATVPLYPPLARTANMQGIVHVSVTTDGHRVTSAHAEDGPKAVGYGR